MKSHTEQPFTRIVGPAIHQDSGTIILIHTCPCLLPASDKCCLRVSESYFAAAKTNVLTLEFICGII